MGGVRDNFSNNGFFEALAPQSFDGTAIAGATIDKRGYETITFIVTAGEISGEASAQNGSDSCGWIRMQHGTSNAAGTVVWSNCSAVHIITDLRRSGATLNTSGMASASYAALAVSNAGSGINNGTFFTLGGLSDISDAMWTSQAFGAGYIGDHRWVRLVVSVSAAGETSAIGIQAIAVAGLPGDWPVNTNRITG